MLILKQDSREMKKVLTLFSGIYLLVGVLLLLCDMTDITTWKVFYLIVMLPYLVIQGFIMFHYTKNKNSAIFMSSLPFSKGELFIRKWWSGLLFLTGLTTIYGIIWIVFGSGILIELLHCFLLGVTYHCIVTFCAIATGRNETYFILFLCLAIIPYIGGMLFISGLQETINWSESVYMGDIETNVLYRIVQYLAPFSQWNQQVVSLEAILINLFYSFLTLLSGYYVCIKNDATSEGEGFRSQLVKDVFVAISTLLVIFIITGLVFGSTTEILLFYIALCFLVPFTVLIIQVLVDKQVIWIRYRNITIITLIISVMSVKMGYQVYENYIPENATTASITVYTDTYDWSYECVSTTMKIEYDVSVAKEIHQQIIDTDIEYGMTMVSVNYGLDDNDIFMKTYYMSEESLKNIDVLDDFTMFNASEVKQIEYLLDFDYGVIDIYYEGESWVSKSEANIQLWKDGLEDYYNEYLEGTTFNYTYDYSAILTSKDGKETITIGSQESSFLTYVISNFLENVAYELNIS